jgi:hypothetical protein
LVAIDRAAWVGEQTKLLAAQILEAHSGRRWIAGFGYSYRLLAGSHTLVHNAAFAHAPARGAIAHRAHPIDSVTAVMADGMSSQLWRAWTDRVKPAADVIEIARVMDATWREVGMALEPIIGKRGAAALLQRCIHLNLDSLPWLADALEPVDRPAEAEPLSAVLGRRSRDEGTSAGGALLRTLHQQLANMIGVSLTDRLLHRIAANLSSGTLPQDAAS